MASRFAPHKFYPLAENKVTGAGYLHVAVWYSTKTTVALMTVKTGRGTDYFPKMTHHLPKRIPLSTAVKRSAYAQYE